MGYSGNDFRVGVDAATGRVNSVELYGQELLEPDRMPAGEISVNGLPLSMRPYPVNDKPGQEPGATLRLKGERFTDHLSGWGLVAARQMGGRPYMQWNTFGINYYIRRELCDMTELPSPGPGGPVCEAPLFVDTFGLMHWPWKFWGEDTRMIYPSSHSQGPADEFGHIGYEHDTPENCKRFLQNVWRRTYPGQMVIHGGLFYNAKTEHWIALTCRRPHVGYQVNIDDAGRGVGYDFTLHGQFNIGDALRMPEIKIYYGNSREEMWRWLGWYVPFYYEQAPEWTRKTLWTSGLAWNNKPTWTQQADAWEKTLDEKQANGISYSLVTNRPIKSGTLPIGYEPDPNHGTQAEFVDMCRRISDRGVPMLVWMSHSGLTMGAQDVDDDWFIRGIDGQPIAGWGSRDGGMMMCNPGHPGYIEYTKRWIRFYIEECGCKGIFFDCLGWCFPPDYKPRPFMRYPGDTNLLTIRFMEEIYAYMRECDPESIMLGEGVSLDGPVNVFSIGGNPVRGIDGWGPRDFFIELNRHSTKRITVDQCGRMNPASGMCSGEDPTQPHAAERNRYLLELLEHEGGTTAFEHVPGDISIHPDQGLLLLARAGHGPPNTPYFPPRDTFTLPEPWDKVTHLREKFSGLEIERDSERVFRGVQPGIYQMLPR